MDIESLDTQIFYWINQHHCGLSDWILWFFSQGWSWAIVLIGVLCLPVMRRQPRNIWLVLLGIGLCILCSDRISVMCFKDVFCRLRPCHALPDVRMFHTSCGGQYGFVSSHAANIFALAMFLSLRYRKLHIRARASEALSTRVSPTLFGCLIFVWAAVVGYSRPYLGKHYPGDVVCGALLGLMIGVAFFFAIQLIENFIDNKYAQKK